MESNTTMQARLVAANNSGNFKSRNGNQVPYIGFRVACDQNYKNQNGDYPTDFWNCFATGNDAQALHKFGQKGRMIVMSGRFRNNNYQSNKYKDQNGHPAKLNSAEFMVNDLSIVFPPRNNGGNYQNTSNNGNYNNGNTVNNTPQSNTNNTNQDNGQPQNNGNNQTNQNSAPQNNGNQGNSFTGNKKIDVSDDDLPF